MGAAASKPATLPEDAVSNSRNRETQAGDTRPQALSEHQLIERSRQGEHAAFRELYDSNVDRIYRLTYRVAGEDDLTRDFTQEAFVRAYQKLDRFREEFWLTPSRGKEGVRAPRTPTLLVAREC